MPTKVERAMTVDIPAIISVDDHVVEPPDLWERWLPTNLAQRGPHVVRSPYEMHVGASERFTMSSSGPTTDFWVYEDTAIAVDTASAAAGQAPERLTAQPIGYDEMRPGCFDRAARLEDMDLGGIERSLCFPTYPRFCGQTFLEGKDRDLALACVRAYNDWMVEEWTGDSGGRLLPLCLVPLWDPELAATEVRRNADRGVRAVAFSELPQFLGLPSLHDTDRHWDPFLAACDQTGTVICMHIGSASRLTTTADDAPPAAQAALLTVNSQLCLTDWILSAALARFPGLNLAFSESQIGWMPYLLQRLDVMWKQHHGTILGLDALLTRPPSTYAREQIFGCVIDDLFGIQSREAIGIEQIMFEVDYPHMDSTWPDTAGHAGQTLAGLTDQEIELVIRGNAIRLFQLPETLSN
jgi:predicted TIM-barrel fold metal-dependent hydrolase